MGMNRKVHWVMTNYLHPSGPEIPAAIILFIFTKCSNMKQAIFLLLTITALNTSAQSLSKRVVHNNPSIYRQTKCRTCGSRTNEVYRAFRQPGFTTNLLYLHVGEIPDKAGIGQHFSSTIERIYVIFDGGAESL